MQAKATLVRARVKCVKVYSYILEDRECKALFMTMNASCKLYFKGDNMLWLSTSNSLVDHQLPFPPLSAFEQDRDICVIPNCSTVSLA